MSTVLFVISFLHGIIVTILLRRYYHIFFSECRLSYGAEWACYGLLFGVAVLNSLTVGTILKINLLVNVITKYFITFIYKGSHKQRIWTTLLFMGVVALFEAMLAALMLPASVDLNNSANQYIFHIVGPLYSVIFLYVFVIILEGMKNTRMAERFSFKYWICFILTPLLSYMIIVWLMSASAASVADLAFCCILILAINLSSFYFYEIVTSYIKNKAEKDIVAEKNLYYAKQLEVMTEFADSMRSFQHDLKHHAIVLDSYMEREEYEKLRSYCDDVFTLTNAYDSVVQSGNATIDSIMNYKIYEARYKGLRLEPSIAVPKELAVSSSDLVVVLGNLLDNAMEAAANAEDKRIFLRLFYDRGCLLMRIRNAHRDHTRKEGGRFLSTKEHAALHGYGLRNVKSIVKENGGTLNINDENGYFVVDILLNDR